MSPPPYLQIATLLNSPATAQDALTILHAWGPDRCFDALRALLPYLTLHTVIRLWFDELTGYISSALSDLIDVQGDWVVSAQCPPALRDSYLVHYFDSTCNVKDMGILQDMRELFDRQYKLVESSGMVIDAEADHYYEDSESESDERDETPEDKKPCSSLTDFEKRLAKKTDGLLQHVDWSNVLMAGGGVLGIVTGKHQSEAYDKSDIDLLLYGLQPDELVPKIASLIEQIKTGVRMSNYWGSSSINPSATKTLVVKGFNAITIVPPLYATNRRKVQIILQHHASIFEALAWFDLDACAMGYTGSAVVALPRAVRSLSFSSDASGGINFLDPWTARKGDPTGNMLAGRAIKYMSRGFSLALSPAAATAIAAQGQDFDSALTKAMLASAASTPSAPVFGLGGLKRREDFASAALAQKREARREERHGGCYDR